MRVVFRCGLFAAGLLLFAGCGESKGDKVFKNNIRLLNSTAEAYELIAKNPSPEEVKECAQRINNNDSEIGKNKETLTHLTIGEVRALNEKYKGELESATERLKKAVEAVVSKKSVLKKGEKPTEEKK